MILKEARVTNFKSIEDSSLVEIDPQITALVGQNESGKTAFLQALYKARPVESGVGYDITSDYPRMRMVEYEEKHEESPDVVAELSYYLEDHELESVNQSLGLDLFEELSVVLNHKYGNSFTIRVVLDGADARYARWLAENVEVTPPVREALKAANSIRSLLAAFEKQDLNAGEHAELKRLQSLLPDNENWASRLSHALWSSHIKDWVPKFMYFDDYRILPGKINLNSVKSKIDSDTDLDDEEKGIVRLLNVARVSVDRLLNPDSFEQEVARLEATSNNITQKVFKFWRQNPGLSVEFRVSSDSKDDPPFNSGKNLYIRIKNPRHGVTVPFEQRSKGFIWFFSFIAWFDSIRAEMETGRRLILLLDEPGLSLHALAQDDYLRYIESLSQEHQIVYTTHSPFMVESGHLDRVRTVEDRTDDGTTVSGDISRSDTKTLFPLQAALGYSIAQNLFISDRNLLVEGVADLSFLQAASNVLRDAGRVGLDDDITITPVGGLGKVSAFASLFGANELQIAVLHDYEGHDDPHLSHLVREKLLPKRGVLHYAMFRTDSGSDKPTDIEDLLNPATYLNYLNQAYSDRLPKQIKVADLPPGDRIVRRIGQYLQDNAIQLRQSGGYNHYLPAKAFASSPPSSLTENEMDRLENMFRSINKALTKS